ncbi:uncharacterized protein METZ01_LOCUS181502 [marine metagenome]|uniref:Uncharacterized protein n=1 Tax=marine metagenome TaxID=408172 RepID=A0A382CR69_9ZZZZ
MLHGSYQVVFSGMRIIKEQFAIAHLRLRHRNAGLFQRCHCLSNSATEKGCCQITGKRRFIRMFTIGIRNPVNARNIA